MEVGFPKIPPPAVVAVWIADPETPETPVKL